MAGMKRARHNLSHYRLATMDMGYLVPVACLEVLMGDSFVHTTRALIRASTMVAPVMHPVDVRIHHWYVPNRVIWNRETDTNSSWDEFITGRDPAETVPTVTYTEGSSDYSLLDHLGVPKGANQTLCALPIRAYNKIYNEFYRDQDLITAVAQNDLALKRIAWAKDYFTSARANPQQGTAISIPFQSGTKAPVKGIGVETGQTTHTGNVNLWETDATSARSVPAWTTGASDIFLIEGEATNTAVGSSNTPQIYADLSQSVGGGININDFRLAMAMQKHLEARNRYGSRIQDYLAYHGIRPRDGRLDLPEYLGGGKHVVSFSEVLATANTEVDTETTHVGDMAGHGISGMRTRPYRHFFPESGWVLSLLSIRPRTIYETQLHRMWLRSSKNDFWQKEYEMLGPQAVLKKEVYAKHGNTTDILGYNGRHDEYRRHPSYVTGTFRTSTDDHWHMARILESAPSLNAGFIECIPTDRIYADTTEPEIRAMVSHDISARRLVRKVARY